MKELAVKISFIFLVISLIIGLASTTAHAQEDVTWNQSDLPVDVLGIVFKEFHNPNNPEIKQLQFRGLNLTGRQAAELFFASEPEENILPSIGNSLKNEQQVKFAGTVDDKPFETQVEREDDGTLHLKLRGIDVSNLSPGQIGELLGSGFDRIGVRGLGDEKIEIKRQDDGTIRADLRGLDTNDLTPQQFTNLAVSNGLDRLHIRGTNGERFEIRRRDDGSLRAEIRGIDASNLNLAQLTSLAAQNEFDRLRIRGTDGERFRIDRKSDGSLRADIRGMDLKGMTAEQLADLAAAQGLDRLRIRGSRDERFEIDRRDNGTLRARIERMDFGNRDPREVLDSLREKGLDRVRLRGLDSAGNRVRIEYRQDKGIVKWEGAGRGVTEFSRDLNNDHARDRGRDWENKLRERVDRGDHGLNRMERSVRERLESQVRDRIERHGRSGRH